ncbi:hypothetical protein BD780_003669 [Clostridium tetanomorphum]|uniref:hypothetical protein n=1 Tax=Clostridium tetanomorphum TaxID=1553 RepID=UPI0004535764|nr:hypothetical protein [Clostridium tetanomorphum]KAJ50855.1 hypothetical protein CTM_15912 [Clostridium tetanomorphum DSM 665]MBP1865498.1 hypothetical protein [Clostridium tetanomorphum]NRS86444.1 hypothetical protein [Clostridium tetanomorphum]SQC00867.1 Uncharacterised protein [Clostridium tetanomorphum]
MSFITTILTATLVALSFLLKIKDENSNKKISKTEKNIKFILFFIIVISSVFLLIYTYIEPKIIISSENIKINGMYGESHNIKEILNVDLIETLPNILSKSHGISIGNVHKGLFKLSDIGLSKLFIHSNKGPYVFIKFENNTYMIINFRNTNNTYTLFNRLLRYINK